MKPETVKIPLGDVAFSELSYREWLEANCLIALMGNSAVHPDQVDEVPLVAIGFAEMFIKMQEARHPEKKP